MSTREERIRSPFLDNATPLSPEVLELLLEEEERGRLLTWPEMMRIQRAIKQAMTSVRRAKFLWDGETAAAAAYRPVRFAGRRRLG